ncbi:MAG: aminotransferase, partial [Acidimicrobiales bacterium]
AATDVAASLRAHGVNVSVSSPGSARYAFDQTGLGDGVRASVHCYNTDDEIDRAVAMLAAHH